MARRGLAGAWRSHSGRGSTGPLLLGRLAVRMTCQPRNKQPTLTRREAARETECMYENADFGNLQIPSSKMSQSLWTH